MKQIGKHKKIGDILYWQDPQGEGHTLLVRVSIDTTSMVDSLWCLSALEMHILSNPEIHM